MLKILLKNNNLADEAMNVARLFFPFDNLSVSGFDNYESSGSYLVIICGVEETPEGMEFFAHLEDKSIAIKELYVISPDKSNSQGNYDNNEDNQNKADNWNNSLDNYDGRAGDSDCNTDNYNSCTGNYDSNADNYSSCTGNYDSNADNCSSSNTDNYNSCKINHINNQDYSAHLPWYLKQNKSRLLKVKIMGCLYKLLERYTQKVQPWGMLTGIRPVKLVHEAFENGIDVIGAIDILKNIYKVKEENAKLLTDIAFVQNRLSQNTKTGNLPAVYIGIPFCKSRCFYCSFTSYPANDIRIMEAYMDALYNEFRCFCEKYGRIATKCVYIGGGTPTALDMNQFKRLFAVVEEFLDMSKGTEFTIEAGRPDTISEEKLCLAKEFIDSNKLTGRISINPQTMNVKTLEYIGRKHTPDDIKNAFLLARQLGFDNINMDIIAGLPDETEEMFSYTMDEISGLKPENITVHTLTVKRASKLHEKLTPQMIEAFIQKTYQIGKMLEIAQLKIREAGMHPYYIYRQKNTPGNFHNTGYCIPGRECLYNVHIMEELGDVIAFGADAVSKAVFKGENRIERAFNLKDLKSYIDRNDRNVEQKLGLFLQ